MKEFIKIGDYYVKDKRAREDIEDLKGDLENLPTGSGALPKVDEKDNGKVLQVNNGQWDKGILDFATKDYVDNNKGTKLYLHEIACDGAIVGGGNYGTNVLYTVFIVNALASIDSVFNALNVPVLHISVTDEGGNYMVLDIMREGSTIYLGILNPDGVVYVRVDAELGIETTELSKYGE